MMKLHQIGLILALLLSAAVPSAHSGTTSSFKSGFSSQKSSPTSSTRAKPSTAPKSGFGSFGQAKPSPAPVAANDASAAAPASKPLFGSFGKSAPAPDAAPAAPKSALTQNLDQGAAQQNALRTLDARKAAAAAAAAPPPPVAQPQPVQAAPQYGQSPYPQPIIVQQQSGGFGHAVMGFMLGRAMSGGNHNNGYPNQNYGNGNGNGNVQAGMPGAEPRSSFGATVLRTFLWLAIIGGIGWLIYFAVRRYKRVKQDSAPNYSFERE